MLVTVTFLIDFVIPGLKETSHGTQYVDRMLQKESFVRFCQEKWLCINGNVLPYSSVSLPLAPQSQHSDGRVSWMLLLLV